MPSAARRNHGPAHEHVLERIEASAAVVRERLTSVPDVAIILGTGLGGLARRIASPVQIAYGDIPGFPLSTVESHEGRLIGGRLAGRPVVAMHGRFHRYEGYSLRQATFPVRVLRHLGARVLVVSNACGGMRTDWQAGDLMLLADHLNLLGDHPLIGPNDERLGPRFPDCSMVYDAALRALAGEIAGEQGTTLREGIYAAVAGPADVVGMSTVPEALVAAHGGMRVLGVSIITDMCIPETLEPASLEKILAVAGEAEPKLTALVEGVVARL
jgi:purine-nucleoside phosphorylase